MYLVAAGCPAAGFADFPLLALHLKKAAMVGDAWIPALYALARGWTRSTRPTAPSGSRGAVMGVFYDVSITGLVVFSVVVQLAAVPMLLVLRGRSMARPGALPESRPGAQWVRAMGFARNCPLAWC